MTISKIMCALFGHKIVWFDDVQALPGGEKFSYWKKGHCKRKTCGCSFSIPMNSSERCAYVMKSKVPHVEV